MYVISAYEVVDVGSESYFLTCALGAKIPSHALTRILMALNQQEKREISEEELMEMAFNYHVDLQALKHILISKLHILKPLLSRKIPVIYLSADDTLVETLIGDTLKAEYPVHDCPNDFLNVQTPSLIIYYRQNYADPDFKRIHQALPDDVYLITCGVLHHQLVIDNIYFNHSGLPTHFSNLHALMMDLNPDHAVSNKDSLSFYRGLYKRQIEPFPRLTLNSCQRGYIAYAINQFLARFVKFDGLPTPYDAINWRWRVDLLKFGLQKEVAILEPQ